MLVVFCDVLLSCVSLCLDVLCCVLLLVCS